jgi:hypothetical protein
MLSAGITIRVATRFPGDVGLAVADAPGLAVGLGRLIVGSGVAVGALLGPTEGSSDGSIVGIGPGANVGTGRRETPGASEVAEAVGAGLVVTIGVGTGSSASVPFA